MVDLCGFHDDHDPETGEPRGEPCLRQAVEEILWVDGSTSVACDRHGVDAIDEEARHLVVRVRPLWSKGVVGG